MNPVLETDFNRVVSTKNSTAGHNPAIALSSKARLKSGQKQG